MFKTVPAAQAQLADLTDSKVQKIREAQSENMELNKRKRCLSVYPGVGMELTTKHVFLVVAHTRVTRYI